MVLNYVLECETIENHRRDSLGYGYHRNDDGCTSKSSDGPDQ